MNPDQPIDYRKLGEYVAHVRLAREAANRRVVGLSQMAAIARRCTENLNEPVPWNDLSGLAMSADKATRDMLAAVDAANAAAALCGERAVSLGRLLAEKD